MQKGGEGVQIACKMVLQSVLLIRIGKQNVLIIDKYVKIAKSKNELFEIPYILM